MNEDRSPDKNTGDDAENCVSLPLVQCHEWCAERDGHPGAVDPEDQLCTSEPLSIPLERADRSLEVVTRELVDNEFSIRLGADFGNVELTPEGAGTLIKALEASITRAADGRVRRVLPADEWTARATAALASAADRIHASATSRAEMAREHPGAISGNHCDYSTIVAIDVTTVEDVAALIHELRPVVRRVTFGWYGASQLVGIYGAGSPATGLLMAQAAKRAVGRISPAAAVGCYTAACEPLASMLGHALADQQAVTVDTGEPQRPSLAVDRRGLWSRIVGVLSGRRGVR